MPVWNIQRVGCLMYAAQEAECWGIKSYREVGNIMKTTNDFIKLGCITWIEQKWDRDSRKKHNQEWPRSLSSSTYDSPYRRNSIGSWDTTALAKSNAETASWLKERSLQRATKAHHGQREYPRQTFTDTYEMGKGTIPTGVPRKLSNDKIPCQKLSSITPAKGPWTSIQTSSSNTKVMCASMGPRTSIQRASSNIKVAVAEQSRERLSSKYCTYNVPSWENDARLRSPSRLEIKLWLRYLTTKPMFQKQRQPTSKWQCCYRIVTKWRISTTNKKRQASPHKHVQCKCLLSILHHIHWQACPVKTLCSQNQEYSIGMIVLTSNFMEIKKKNCPKSKMNSRQSVHQPLRNQGVRNFITWHQERKTSSTCPGIHCECLKCCLAPETPQHPSSIRHGMGLAQSKKWKRWHTRPWFEQLLTMLGGLVFPKRQTLAMWSPSTNCWTHSCAHQRHPKQYRL